MSVGLRNPQALLFATVVLVASALVAWYVTTGSEPPEPMKGERPLDPAPQHLPHPSEVRAARDKDTATAPSRVDATPHATESPAAVDASTAREQPRLWIGDEFDAVSLWLGYQEKQFANPWQLEGSGTLRASYPDGTPMVEGQFVDGQPDGPWTRWHADGRLMSTVTYQRGVPHGEFVKYHSNGLIAERQMFDAGRLEGQSIAWHENGQIKEQGNWSGGKRNGTWRWFDESGQGVREEQWHDGARVGPVKMFDVAANPAAEQERERRAAMDGRYSGLLRRIAAPDDRQSYSDFRDYGYYQAIAEYQGEKDVPAGYWVYVYPYWYIWGERR
ncbi:MAG TPA: toxin-antitoxin system YwqK family antitoxin [Planctomycetota bacterium]|nr:toxin-antitoxin system YwqK family antitoxin [Planctomycetota bacterium]